MMRLFFLTLALLAAFPLTARAAVDIFPFRCSGRQYKIAVSGTASAAQSLPEVTTLWGSLIPPAARVEPDGTDIVVKFGDASVVADATATANKLGVGNFHAQNGVVELFSMQNSDTYVSVISSDEVSTGTVWICIGRGN